VKAVSIYHSHLDIYPETLDNFYTKAKFWVLWAEANIIFKQQSVLNATGDESDVQTKSRG
jgi:hypothetical protein